MARDNKKSDLIFGILYNKKNEKGRNMIGIVILIYNEWNLSINCINSIRKTCNNDYTIYLIDNASTVSMTNEFRQYLCNSKDIVFIRNEQNRGYSAGNNVGISRALADNCDYILISNNDVIFKDNTVRDMASFLSEHKKYGIIGPKIYTRTGETQEINMVCKMTLSGKYKYVLRKTPFSFVSKKFVGRFHATEKKK